MRNKITIFILFLYLNGWSSSFGPVYPYIQKSDDGKIKCRSVPYGVDDGPNCIGQTFVYLKNKFIYSIDKYFGNPFFITNNGQYIIEFDFRLNYKSPISTINNAKITKTPYYYNGDALNIYKDGEKCKTIQFSELKIDTSKIKVFNYGTFEWNYQYSPDSLPDKLKTKMNDYPAYIEGDSLFLITSDNQLIQIQISTGQIVSQKNALETLKNKKNWTPTSIKRKYEKVKYPDKFILPKLKSGKTIEQGLAQLLNKNISDRDSGIIELYIHTLLINKQGKCELLYINIETRQEITADFERKYNGTNISLKTEIENWIKQQTFSTKTFPKKFLKFKYTDFVFLR